MSRSDNVYLQDILESVNIILIYTENKTEFDFTRDVMLQDAVTRRFEIIGEASSRISVSFKKQYPGVRWRLMTDMRNKLIHEYFGVSLTTIYLSIKHDLPILKEQLEKIVQ
jgi:uncharacterized protein with HEPN domain